MNNNYSPKQTIKIYSVPPEAQLKSNESDRPSVIIRKSVQVYEDNDPIPLVKIVKPCPYTREIFKGPWK